MRLAFLGLMFLLVSRSAFAAPTTDLVFCSKLPDKTERIACYDAAARIAEARPRQQHAVDRPSQISTPARSAYASAAPAPLSEAPPPRFHGAYAALGGSFGMSEPVSFNGSPDLNSQGWSGVGVAGYNLQSGNFVLGLELSGRYGNETANALTSSSFGGGFLGPTGWNTAYNFYNDASAHLAARAGMAIGNTFVFAKAGIGAAHTKEQANLTAFGVDCRSFGVVGGVVVCTNSAPAVLPTGSPTYAIVTSHWYPSGVVGVGLEQNFGWAFGRLGFEAEGVKSRADAYWTARATGMVGVRF